MDPSLLLSLQQLGWTDKQARTYLALLQLGEGPTSKIAELAGLNRSVTYETLAELVGMGYATEVGRHKVKRYAAVGPQKIFHAARAHFENFKFMLPLFQALHHRGEKKPRVEFYEGEEALARMFQTFDTGSERRFMASYAQIERHFPSEFKRWQQRVKHLKTLAPTKHILADDLVSRGFARAARGHAHFVFRFLPKGTDISMDLAIVDDVLAITNFDPLSMVVIRSAELTRSAAILFDLAWMSARK